MNRKFFWKILLLVTVMGFMMGMSVCAEEEDLTLVSVSGADNVDELVMANGHGRVSIDGSMLSLWATNNSLVELNFIVNSFGDPTDSFEILIYRGTQDALQEVVCSKVDNFSDTPGGEKYTYQWNTKDLNRYPAGDYTIVVTSYYYSDKGKAVSDVDSLGIQLGDYRMVLDRAFAARMYSIVLGRPASENELTYWGENLFNGRVTGADTIYGFINGPEFVNKHTSNKEYLQVLYRAIFDREPGNSELEYWLQIMEGGISRNYVLKGFVDSAEFGRLCAEYGIVQGTVALKEVRDLYPQIAGFVNRLYKLMLERNDDGSGINYWVDILVKKTRTPQAVAHDFVFSPEFVNKNLGDADFSRIMYRAMMDRDGADVEISYYQELMRGGMTREKVFSCFANSPEFSRIVASYGL